MTVWREQATGSSQAGWYRSHSQAVADLSLPALSIASSLSLAARVADPASAAAHQPDPVRKPGCSSHAKAIIFGCDLNTICYLSVMEPIHMSPGPSDDDDELREDWAQRLASGRPMVTYEVDTPVTLTLDARGRLDIDCPCLRVSASDLAGVLRLRLGPQALCQLLSFFQDLNVDSDPLCIH